VTKREAVRAASERLLSAFGSAAPAEPEPPRDRLADRQRRAAVAVEPGRVSRAALVETLNAFEDERVIEHVRRSRAAIDAEDGTGELSPYRRDRPVAKADTPRTRIHREARVMAAAIVNSRGAYVIQAYLRKLRAIFSGQPLAHLRAAALCPIGAFCRYTYADDCARRRIATGLLMLVCGQWTSKRQAFGSRSRRRGLLIAGISVHTILRLVTPVGRRPYERHTFSRRGESLGDMALFERHGFALRKRLPAARCNRWEIGESGQPRNRYWIGCVVSRRDQRGSSRSRARAQSTALAETLGDVVLDAVSHEIGWAWADETPQYAPPRVADGTDPPF
jgi:hypothetical protein